MVSAGSGIEEPNQSQGMHQSRIIFRKDRAEVSSDSSTITYSSNGGKRPPKIYTVAYLSETRNGRFFGTIDANIIYVPHTPSNPENVTYIPSRLKPAEAVVAHNLDQNDFIWQHEPHTIVFKRNNQGEITDAFTPDFFFPELNRYLELTIMKQYLMSHDKNRKVGEARGLGYNVVLYNEKDVLGFIGRKYPHALGWYRKVIEAARHNDQRVETQAKLVEELFLHVLPNYAPPTLTLI